MTDISTTLDDWFTTEGDAMTHDEYEAARDADAERRMEREMEDEHYGKAAGAAPAGDEGPATGTDEGRGDDGAQCSA
jgi:hypothetical protein